VTGPGSSARRSAWLDVDLGAIRHNVAVLRSLADGAAVAPVVKAEAYGHGREAVVAAIADRVDAFCVATLDEALAVRSQVGTRVIVLYPVPAGAAAEAARSGIELTIMSRGDLAALRRSASPGAGSGVPGPIAVHLCAETGLGRGGLPPAELLEVVEEAASDPSMTLAGLWTHLASPEDAADAERQVGRLEAVTAALARRGLPMPSRHVAASGGLFAGTAPTYDMIRPGLAVYGVLDEGLPLADRARDAARALRPAMSLRARAVAICEVGVGEGVGYGTTWRAERPSRVAILPLGYADGYLRGTQPGAAALVRGRRCPLAGAISMDALAVDVTDVPGFTPEDEVVLLGEQDGASIAAGDLARARNTIAWEVLSGMAARLTRVYHPTAGPVHPDPQAGAVPESSRPIEGAGEERAPSERGAA
jgi:alanine racemase